MAKTILKNHKEIEVVYFVKTTYIHELKTSFHLLWLWFVYIKKNPDNNKRRVDQKVDDGSTEVFVLFFDPLFWQPFINLSVWLFKGRFINAQKKSKFFAGTGFENHQNSEQSWFEFSRQKSYFRYFSGWKICGVDGNVTGVESM